VAQTRRVTIKWQDGRLTDAYRLSQMKSSACGCLNYGIYFLVVLLRMTDFHASDDTPNPKLYALLFCILKAMMSFPSLFLWLYYSCFKHCFFAEHSVKFHFEFSALNSIRIEPELWLFAFGDFKFSQFGSVYIFVRLYLIGAGPF